MDPERLTDYQTPPQRDVVARPLEIPHLCSLVDGDEDLARDLFVLLSSEIPAQSDRLAEALRSQDRRQLVQVAHRLKGTLLNIAAPHPAAMAADLEGSADHATFDELQQLANLLQRQLCVLLEQVDALVGHGGPIFFVNARSKL